MSCQYNNQVIILLIQAFEHQNWGANAQLPRRLRQWDGRQNSLTAVGRSGGLSATQKLTRANT